MSATIARPQTQEPSHWYWPYTGEPCYETQPGKPTTLRDARKLGLVPSVTTILSCRHKPALQSWLVEQAVLAAVTTPRLPDESLDAFIERVLHTERHQDQESDKAKARGTQIHDAMEKLFKGEPIDEEIKPWVWPAFDELAKWGAPLRIEHCFAANGYGGRCDLVMRSHGLFGEAMDIVFDFKSAKKIPDKSFDDHRLQIAAYAIALDCVNNSLMLGTDLVVRFNTGFVCQLRSARALSDDTSDKAKSLQVALSSRNDARPVCTKDHNMNIDSAF